MAKSSGNANRKPGRGKAPVRSKGSAATGKRSTGKQAGKGRALSSQDSSSSLETVAKFALPAFLGVLGICATTLAVIWFTRPSNEVAEVDGDQPYYSQPVRTEDDGDNAADDGGADEPDVTADPPRVAESEPAEQPSEKPVATGGDTNGIATSSPALASSTPAENAPSVAATKASNDPPMNNVASSAPATAEPANGLDTTVTSTTVSGQSVFEWSVENGNVKFAGPNFDLGSSVGSIQTEGDAGFAFVQFDGTNQHVLLPPVPQTNGSLVVTARMSARRSVILIDSAQERLTIRKNVGGIRWRLGGATKQGSIRNVATSFDDQQWHHFAITWNDGGQAIFYVDGQPVDQFDYVHDNKRFTAFTNVHLSRNAERERKCFPSDVHEVRVFDSPLSSDDVAKMFADKKATFAGIFQ